MAEKNLRLENAKIAKRTMAHEVHELALAIDALKETTIMAGLADMRRIASAIKLIKEAVADRLY